MQRSQAGIVANVDMAKRGLGVAKPVRYVWRHVLHWTVVVYLGNKVQKQVRNNALCANKAMGPTGTHPPWVPTTHPWSTLWTTLWTPF